MASRVVFVGNIPYDATEQQLIDHFSSVGQVVNFRLVHDRDTGKPKGYGFCEYSDSETAHSAIRNLNQAEFHSRALRVDLAEDDTKAMGGVSGYGGGGGGGGDVTMTGASVTAVPVVPSATAIAAQHAQVARAQAEALIALAEKKQNPSAASAASASGSAALSGAEQASLKEVDAYV